MLVGLGSLRGEYTDHSAHPRREEGIRSHDDEAFNTLLHHQALHFDDLLGFSGLSLIAMNRDIRHALAGGIGPPTETVRHGVILSRNIHNSEVKLGQGLMPSCLSGGRTSGGVHVLLVSLLQTLMVGANGDRMEGYVPSPFPESHDAGIHLLFTGRPRPSLAFRQDLAPEGHVHVPPVVKHLL